MFIQMGINGRKGTYMLGGVNCIFNFFGMQTVRIFKRKTLLLYGFMTYSLFNLGIGLLT